MRNRVADIPARDSSKARPVMPSAVQTGWEVVIGVITGLTEAGEPLVMFPRSEGSWPLQARAVVSVGPADAGQKAVLAFEEGDLSRPIVLGLVQSALAGHKQVPLVVDGERVVITADKEIELRCGGASITLTRAGKVLIKGEYVLSASSGVNRIRGGSVQIN